MKCEKCGKEIDETVKFCPECGFENGKLDTCPKCEAEVNKTAKFCPSIHLLHFSKKLPNCGIEVEDDKEEESPEEAKLKDGELISKANLWDARKEGRKVELKKGNGLVFVILALFLLFILFAFANQTPQVQQRPTDQVKNPVYETVRQPILDEMISVGPGEYKYYLITIPTTANVEGDFTAYGGSGNDIIIYIFDETSFTNWVNGHQVGTYYNSGQMTTGTISASLSPGRYYLVYSNTFSTFSTKNVRTTVEYNYQTCVANC